MLDNKDYIQLKDLIVDKLIILEDKVKKMQNNEFVNGKLVKMYLEDIENYKKLYLKVYDEIEYL